MKGLFVLSLSLLAAAGPSPSFAAPTAAGHQSSCSADCLITSCTISCSSGAGGGAACTCAWGFASCACGGGGGIAAAVRFSAYDAAIFQNDANTMFRDAVPPAEGGKRTARPGTLPGRSPLPAAPPQLTLYLPDARKTENLKVLQDLLAAFRSPAAARASAAAAALQAALGRRDAAAYQKAADDYQKEVRALRPAEQKAVSRVADLGASCAPGAPR